MIFATVLTNNYFQIMKKMFLTGAFALIGLMVSAQSFMVTVDLNTDDFTDTDYITNSIGFGYAVNDAFVVGVKNLGIDDGMTAFGRYLWNDNIYFEATALTDVPDGFEMTDFVTIGAGYSFNVFDGLFVEPKVTTLLSPADGQSRDLDFGLGLSYKF